MNKWNISRVIAELLYITIVVVAVANFKRVCGVMLTTNKTPTSVGRDQNGQMDISR